MDTIITREYIPIDVSRVPYSFAIKLGGATYRLEVKYNGEDDAFTVDLYQQDAEMELLCYGDPIRYGRPMWETVNDECFPLPVIIPLCLTGDDVQRVTWDNLGKSVQLFLFDRKEVVEP